MYKYFNLQGHTHRIKFIAIMEDIIKLSESSATATTRGQSIDPEQFSLFMQRKPIWEFYSLTQDYYLQKTNQEKIRLIQNYDKSMMEGKFSFNYNKRFLCN